MNIVLASFKACKSAAEVRAVFDLISEDAFELVPDLDQVLSDFGIDDLANVPFYEFLDALAGDPQFLELSGVTHTLHQNDTRGSFQRLVKKLLPDTPDPAPDR